MIISSMATVDPASKACQRGQSPSFIRKRNLPTPPPSLADVNDSSSCSSSSSFSVSSTYSANTATSSSATLTDTNNAVTSCDLLNIITDARFRPVFQAIDEIKRRKCRPDLERILKYVEKRSTSTTPIPSQRDELLLIVDDLLKLGLITKVFHKGGFTIRIKNDKYAKLIEKMNVCYSQKTPTATPMSPQEAVAAAAAAGTIPLNGEQWTMPRQYVFNSSEMTHNGNHRRTRETPSPEFAVFKTEALSASQTSVHAPVSRDHHSGNVPRPLSPLAVSQPTKKRNRAQTTPLSNGHKKSRVTTASDTTHATPLVDNHHEHVFLKPTLTPTPSLPPVTIEQLLGLRGDIPNVHNWSTDELNAFFHQQGYDYASVVLHKHRVNGDELYRLTREQVFIMSALKIGKALKLWNVIEQIQRNNPSASSFS